MLRYKIHICWSSNYILVSVFFSWKQFNIIVMHQYYTSTESQATIDDYYDIIVNEV